jgi:DNA-binding CsgD family transcriptional regulator
MPQSVVEYTDRTIKRHIDKMQRICEPLQRCFGINYFTYHIVRPDGAWMPMVSRLDWATFYAENQFCLYDPFLLHPKHYRSGSFLWTHTLSDPYLKKVVDSAWTKFDMDYGLCIVERTPEGCEFFGFSAPKENLGIYSTYLNDMPLLRKFCLYFKEAMGTALDQAARNPIDLLSLKGNAFLKQEVQPFTNSQAALEFSQFILSPQRYKLSNQEKECLSIYLDELSMKEAAARMHLSPRTIESYLSNIKNKLDCTTKSELIKKGRELRSIGLIP